MTIRYEQSSFFSLQKSIFFFSFTHSVNGSLFHTTGGYLMKRIWIAGIALIAIVVLGATQQDGQEEAAYTGAEYCNKCHHQENLGDQATIWEESGHARSYEVLTSEKVVAKAKERGDEVLPADNPKCLECHAPLYEKAPDFMEEGVTCEACHNPAKNHMQEDVELWCLPCHEKAHGTTDFDLKAAWEKVKHPMPEKEEEK
jgi:hypothetical protein